MKQLDDDESPPARLLDYKYPMQVSETQKSAPDP